VDLGLVERDQSDEPASAPSAATITLARANDQSIHGVSCLGSCLVADAAMKHPLPLRSLGDLEQQPARCGAAAETAEDSWLDETS